MKTPPLTPRQRKRAGLFSPLPTVVGAGADVDDDDDPAWREARQRQQQEREARELRQVLRDAFAAVFADHDAARLRAAEAAALATVEAAKISAAAIVEAARISAGHEPKKTK